MKVSLYLIPILFIAGCLTGSEDINALFGYRYRVVQTDQFPVISSDSMIVNLQYEGCNKNQEFTLQYREKSPDHLEIWLFKNTPDQFCELVLREVRSFKLPPDAFSASEVYLLGPKGVRVLMRK